MTPLRDQSGVDTSSSPKTEKPGTRKNGVHECIDGTFKVRYEHYQWTGPKIEVIYHATRAEADAQRAAWIEIGWLPEPSVSNAVSKSTFEAPLAH